MSTPQLEPLQHRRLSLSVRVSLGLVIAAILPLIIALLFSELQARPTLIAQANTAMKSDAKTRVQLIDTYFSERILDAETLAQVTSEQQFLAAPPAPASPQYQNLALHAIYGLAAGIFRDKHYTTWILFDPQGQPRLFYPTNNPPKPHGKSFVAPQYLQAVQAGKTFVSPVYYTPDTHIATVDIYSPIYNPAAQGKPPTYLGFIRATLNIDYIWNIVNGDLGSNGTGSYAFILDENGVRIADTNPSRLFKAVAPLDQATQQQIISEERYGATNPVPVLADGTAAQQLRSASAQTTFQIQPTGEQGQFQAVEQATSTTHWHYFVLSPVSTITAVADQQLWFTVLMAFAFSTLVAIFGLIVGRGITRPIIAAVNYLRDSSHSLSTLATRQQDASTEQTWVVDSTQVGLQSVQYYTDAIGIAARKLNEIGTALMNNWEQMEAWRVRQALEQIIAAANYIENATDYQNTSNQKLATALKVATQVTEQLVDGSTSATDAAMQLEQVVTQLRNVVGK